MRVQPKIVAVQLRDSKVSRNTVETLGIRRDV
jgi:hypothetical protein